MELDVAAIIAAGIAFITALLTTIITAFLSSKESKKKDMLDNLTAARLSDLRNIDKLSVAILSEAAIATKTNQENKQARIKKLILAENELRFLLKPVYDIDCDVLVALKELSDAIISLYRSDAPEKADALKTSVAENAAEFRRLIFLYRHSSWTCIKQQIVKNENSTYAEFQVRYRQHRETLEKDRKKSSKKIWEV